METEEPHALRTAVQSSLHLPVSKLQHRKLKAAKLEETAVPFAQKGHQIVL
jgi:hypothetical protein